MLLAGLVVLMVPTALGCRHCASWYARRQVQKMEIRVTSVVAKLSPTRPPLFRVTVELSNVNEGWMDLTSADYCLLFRGVKVRCDRFPAEGARVRVLGSKKVETVLVIEPGPADVSGVLSALLAGHGAPLSVLEGTAHVETAVGVLDFEFRTEPITVDLKQITVELGGNED